MTNLEEQKYWVWLSLIEGVGCIKKRKILEKYKTPEKIYNLEKEELLKIEGIGDETARKIIGTKNEQLINYHIKYMKENNIEIININEKEYPEKLKQIYDAPISLYIKGNKQILNGNNISIIGCRDCTDYGKKAAKYFAYNLSMNGINIVSGLARGIDSLAHVGSLCAKKNEYKVGKTIAVLGNGLDTIYPKENLGLTNEILRSGGCIISEYPCGTKPNKMNFPARNRIVSGLSNGIIVVEAKEKSGTLITVDFALEQGRDVFVVPGNINSINSVGTNELIKQGAKLITNYKDII